MASGFASASDDMLMAEVVAGNHKAFAELVERHHRRFYAVAYRSVFSKAEAEDIVQEAFLKLWRKPALFDSRRGAKFSTWFYMLVLNLCRDTNRRRLTVPLNEDDWLATPDASPNWEESRAESQQKNRVEQALATLPERQREALVLCYYEELSNKQAAEIMGIHIKALESLIARAKAGLRNLLGHEMKESA